MHQSYLGTRSWGCGCCAGQWWEIFRSAIEGAIAHIKYGVTERGHVSAASFSSLHVGLVNTSKIACHPTSVMLGLPPMPSSVIESFDFRPDDRIVAPSSSIVVFVSLIPTRLDLGSWSNVVNAARPLLPSTIPTILILNKPVWPANAPNTRLASTRSHRQLSKGHSTVNSFREWKCPTQSGCKFAKTSIPPMTKFHVQTLQGLIILKEWNQCVKHSFISTTTST